MLRNVQALRAIAALLVVFDHLNGELAKSDPGAWTLFAPFVYFGQFGVDLFFVISGFIMVTTTWNLIGQPGISRGFILRRLARIYPPYWFVLLPVLIAYFASAHVLMPSHEGRADVLASIFLFPTLHARVLDTSWTLTFEMFFYVVFAFVLQFKRSTLVPLLGMWFVFEVGAGIAWHGSSNVLLGFLSSPLPIEFILGALIGYQFRVGSLRGATACGILGCAIAICVWIASSNPSVTAVLTNEDFFRVLQFGIPAALIVYASVGLEVKFGARVPSVAVQLGDASYATYLWHSPIVILIGFVAGRVHIRGFIGDTFVQLATIVVAISVSLTVYRFFERPVTNYLNRRIGGLMRVDTLASLATR